MDGKTQKQETVNARQSGGRGIRRLAAAAVIPLVLLIAACGSPANNTNGTTGGGAKQTSTTCKAPDFTGPYATEFKDAYDQSKTELAKRILEDCRITDAELNEILDAQNQCLAPYGLVATKGQLARLRESALSDEEMNQKNSECAEKTDLWNVESMYDTTQDNPDNLDAEALHKASYECLKTHDLLPKPLTEQEYLDMEVSNAQGLSEEQIAEKTRKWNEFYNIYMEYNDDGSRNPNYDAAKATQFWQCQTDPVNQ